ncbi:MAG: type I-D CRISPR-associated protein Cas5/Csc1 [Candidatus Thermoplasmatota archaeon]|nr:type I-D CRISPR-associated protein Cas5/Csc1 [Euryarchaeota archaeon]MBU4032734.1 type I-D CRISPR-associated protein Cas5/Csc1 [Candidatus Thermoplasmatota archaeon]MBU4144274.1 type I-D CRISPR-associated protein Cas5/Csc1 [Candidatus Thermoplasmatota archaeon]MBU4592346.1 type I-D CRISPR-associated protein Cas5/Csc1 [Candidatus Thermoplasmatota archaeon]
MFAYEATLHLENPLSFRSNEYGNIIKTGQILHNWALRFALNGIHGDPEKDHLENLKGQPIYATPAIPLNTEFEFQTFHPFPEAPQLLKNPEKLTPGSRKTYQGKYTVLQYKEVVRAGSTFRFAVASTKQLDQEFIITYGGKQTLQRVNLEDADEIIEIQHFKGEISHPINPLDFSDNIKMTDTFQYSIPPSPLFEGTIIEPIRAQIIKKGPNRYVVPVLW